MDAVESGRLTVALQMEFVTRFTHLGVQILPFAHPQKVEVLLPAQSAERVAAELAPLVTEVCLLYTSDAADDLPCVDLGGRRIIKKKKK